MFMKTIAVGPAEEVEDWVTGGTTVAMLAVGCWGHCLGARCGWRVRVVARFVRVWRGRWRLIVLVTVGGGVGVGEVGGDGGGERWEEVRCSQVLSDIPSALES